MKLKYYLRGLGVGIAVTVFIMSCIGKTEELTDAQIKMRALELGMVEETVLADLHKKTQEKENEDQTKIEEEFATENTDEIFKEAGEAEIWDLEEKKELENHKTEETENDTMAENKETEEEDKIVSSEIEEKEGSISLTEEQSYPTRISEENIESYIIIAVEPGNGSETISRRLYNAGLVESAVEFNRYLVEYGYDTSIIVGNHEIPVNADREEIIKILCGL